jgi:hypothetical protein
MSIKEEGEDDLYIRKEGEEYLSIKKEGEEDDEYDQVRTRCPKLGHTALSNIVHRSSV